MRTLLLRSRNAAALSAVAALVLTSCGGPDENADVSIGLITKQEQNPYWVEMREIAEQTAAAQNAELISATGESDVDVASQSQAIQEMIDANVDGILIAPNDSDALNPAINEARQQGIVVIALDTPVDPLDAVDAYFATDNYEAGNRAGRYAAAKAEEMDLDPEVVTLDLAPGISSGEQRHEGFLEGFGLQPDGEELVFSADTEGNEQLGREAMAEALEEHPEANVIYTVNEPVALGALEALEEAGRGLDDVVLVSVDGGCEAMKGPVRDGLIDATVQQFPQNMAREGVNAIISSARAGETPSGYLDTGVQLISDNPAPGVDSREVAFGVRNCWGN